MASNFPALSEDRIRTIDQLRQRLNQLSTSLASLKVDLERNEPLPTWPSLQSSAQIVSHNLGQLLATLEAHSQFFNAAHAFPLTTFPAHTQETLLNQLLRKRLEPTAEEWIKEKDTTAQKEKTNGFEATNDAGKTGRALYDDEIQELWSLAGPVSNAVVKRMIEDEAFEDEFTLSEREAGVETVNTGLVRKLWEDDVDAEDDVDKMEDIRQSGQGSKWADPNATPAMAVETVLSVISTGKLPV